MTRARMAWPLAGMLALLGSQAAHWAAYAAVQPHAGARARLLAETGHGYLAWAPLAVALVVAVSLASFGAAALDAARGRRHGAIARWPFAALPFITFAVQEHLERAASGGLPLDAVLQPTFLVGLLLQAPFALLAYAAARLLMAAAVRLGRALAARRPRHAAALLVPPRPRARLLRLSPLARGASRRGPPEAAPVS